MEYNIDTYNKLLKYYIFINVINNIDIDITLLQPFNASEIESQIENILSRIKATLVSIQTEIERKRLIDLDYAVYYPITEVGNIIKVEGHEKNLTTNMNDSYTRFRFMPHPSIVNDSIGDDLLNLITTCTFVDNFIIFLITSNSNSYNQLIRQRILIFFKGIKIHQNFENYDFSYLKPLLQNENTENTHESPGRKKKRLPFEPGNVYNYELPSINHQKIDNAINKLRGALIKYDLQSNDEDTFNYSICKELIDTSDPKYRLCTSIDEMKTILQNDNITQIKLKNIKSLYNLRSSGRILNSSGLREMIDELERNNSNKGGYYNSRLNWLFHLQGIFVVVASAFYSTITFE